MVSGVGHAGLTAPMSTTQVVLALPIALQEMVLAVWLIASGFNPSPGAAEPVRRGVVATGYREDGAGDHLTAEVTVELHGLAPRPGARSTVDQAEASSGRRRNASATPSGRTVRKCRSSNVAISAEPTRAANATSDASVKPMPRSAYRSASSAASPGGRRPPFHEVGPRADVCTERPNRSRAAACRGQVVRLREHQWRRDQLIIQGVVPLDGAAVSAVSQIEQRVDDRHLVKDHDSLPKPVSAR